MTGSEVKSMSTAEINAAIKQTREKLFSMRNQSQTEKIEDISLFSKLRKDVARLMTERQKRYLADNAAKAPAKAPAADKTPGRAAGKPAAKRSGKTTTRETSKPKTKSRSTARTQA